MAKLTCLGQMKRRKRKKILDKIVWDVLGAQKEWVKLNEIEENGCMGKQGKKVRGG